MPFGLEYSDQILLYRAFITRAFRPHALIAVVLLLMSFAVSAKGGAKDWNGSLGVTSDYVYRGVSSSWERDAYQAGLQMRLGEQWQVGVSASTVETRDNTGTPIEAIASASRNWSLSADWQLRAGYLHHQYFGHRTLYSFDYDELFASASFRSQLALSVQLSPNAARYRYQQSPERGLVAAVEVTWLQPLFWEFSGSVGAGYNDLSSIYGTGYAYGHAALLRDIGPLGLSVMFINTDDHAAYIYGSEITGKRWAATARWRF